MGGANYLREIVSGKKARFIDHETATNLDLVYVTDRIIIMGWPATGIASYYRNRRRDVLKFINSRHGEKWWIWNLCPLYENAYSPESMHNRVSRYPFPDHHPPPLPLLPLAAREMTAWLDGDPERVAIIHCKAGKGRSGTLLCSYMLSLAELPPPPQLDKSYSSTELAQRASNEALPDPKVSAQDRDGWVVVGSGDAVAEIPVEDDHNEAEGSSTPARSERISVPSRSAGSSVTTLSRSSSMSGVVGVSTDPQYDPIDIGDEASAGSKGQSDRTNGKVDAVFKLHSSRRMKPSSTGRGVSIPSQRRWVRYINLLFSHQAPPAYVAPNNGRVRLASITLYLTPPARWQKPLTHMLVGSDAGRGKAWASVARYDDDYVSELQNRGGAGDGFAGTVSWGGVAGDGHYDSAKMFCSCGKMVAASVPRDLEQDDKVVHHLQPENDEPLVLDRSREFRLKFHLGNLPLGWAWLIPAFHLREPTPPTTRTHTLRFPRSQLDFPLGPGQAVEEILVRLEEVPDSATDTPARLFTDSEERQHGLDDTRHEDGRLDGAEAAES